MNFVEKIGVKDCSWQAFERMLSRLLICEGYDNVRQVGGSGDHGADVIASKYHKRWLVQAKQWKKPVGIDVLNDTLKALKDYQAAIEQRNDETIANIALTLIYQYMPMIKNHLI